MPSSGSAPSFGLVTNPVRCLIPLVDGFLFLDNRMSRRCRRPLLTLESGASTASRPTHLQKGLRRHRPLPDLRPIADISIMKIRDSSEKPSCASSMVAKASFHRISSARTCVCRQHGLFAAILLVSVFFHAGCTGQTKRIADRRGALVVVGGGGTPAAVVARSVSLAGGENARVAILPQASQRANAGDETAVMFRKAGAQSVCVVRFDTGDEAPSAATRPATPHVPRDALQSLENASLIWFSGGDQNLLMRRLEAAGLVEIIRDRHRAGAVVGGTSAGAAVLSRLMITGEADLTSLRRGATKLSNGLGLWPGVIVDQHFVKRRRFNRLLSVVLDHRDTLGVGIDERTAVIVGDRSCEVMGESSVMVIDARKASMPDDANPRLDQARDIRIDVCVAGDHIPLGMHSAGH